MNNNCNTIKAAIADSCLLSRISLKRAFSNTENIKIIKDFNNAMDCIAYIESSNPLDIILMDLDLAVMNGIKTTRIIKKKFPDIKIIIHFLSRCNNANTDIKHHKNIKINNPIG